MSDLGGFDERFFLYGEDADLSLRAKAQGRHLVAVPAAVVHHLGASSQASHSTLVERTRADAAIRVAAYHLRRHQALLVRVDMLVVTLLGMLPGLGRTSGSKRARAARLGELARWRLASDRTPFRPV